MPPVRYFAKRLVLAAAVMYLVLSGAFAFVALTPDPNLGNVAYQLRDSPRYQTANASERKEIVEEAFGAYKEPRNLDEPASERYVNWLQDMAALNLGYSISQQAPVLAVLGRAIPVTLVYVLPAVLFATVGGIATGIYAALYSKSAFDRVSTLSSYVAYGIPSFLLALLAVRVVDPALGNAFRLIPGFRAVILPAAVLGTSLFAAQFRYARAQSTEYIGQEFVTLLRAKGASNHRVARHLLRNAALPLLSLFFVDLLGVLVVNVFILETVLRIPGFGGVGLQAIQKRDMPLIIGITLTLATVGIVANLVQDAAYTVLDPRVENE